MRDCDSRVYCLSCAVEASLRKELCYLTIRSQILVSLVYYRGFSSVGRASDLHSEGQEFESPSLQGLHLRL